MEARILKEIENTTVETVESSGGILVVEVNGKEIFHNKKEGVKYGDEDDIIKRIKAE